jgi:hypothetical protein
MSDASHDYAGYDGDSRSSWERLDWIDRRLDYELTINGDDASQTIIVEPEIVYIEIKPTAPNQAMDGVSEEDGGAIDLDLRNWDIYDFVSVIGVALLAVGLIFALLPSMRSWGILFPVGATLMAFAAYGARRRDAFAAYGARRRDAYPA